MSSPLTALNPVRPQEPAAPVIPVVPLLRRAQQDPRPPRPDMPVDPEPESGPGQPQAALTMLDGNPFAMAPFRPAAPQDPGPGAGRMPMNPAFLRGTGVHAPSAAAHMPVGDPASVRSPARQAARGASPHGAHTVAAVGDHRADAAQPLPASDAARTAGLPDQNPPADPPALAPNTAHARDGGPSVATADALPDGESSLRQGDDPSLVVSGGRRARHDSEQGGPIPHSDGRAGAESAASRPPPHASADGAGRRPGGQAPAARADAPGADLPPAAAQRMATVSVPFSSWGPGHRVTASWLPGALAGVSAAPVVLRGSSENAQRAIGAALAADEGMALGHLQVIAAEAPEDGSSERRAARHMPEHEE